jgi:hypothetical protein
MPRALGAVVRKPPKKESAGSGAPGSADAMGIWLGPTVQRTPVAAVAAVAKTAERADDRRNELLDWRPQTTEGVAGCG